MKLQTPNSKPQYVAASRKSAAILGRFFNWRRSYETPLRAGLALAILLLLAAFSAVAQPNASGPKIPPLKQERGEIPPSFWEQHGLWVILGGLFLLLLLGVGLWLLLRPKPPVPVPPAQQARQALEALSLQREDGVVLSRVSQEMRHYLAAAFGLPSGELTTAEFCRLLISRQDIGAPLTVPVTDFLRQCDERKFAPGAPGAPLGAAAQALKFIEQAEARRRAPAQAARPAPNSQ